MDTAETSLAAYSPGLPPEVRVRSAESTPVMLRRYLRISGLFSVCTQSMRPATAEEDGDEAGIDNATSGTIIGRQKFRLSHQKRQPGSVYSSNSTSSVPSSPLLPVRGETGGRVSKGRRFWRNLKRFHFRHLVNADARSSKHGSMSNKVRDRRSSFDELVVNGDGNNRVLNSGSHPNLIASSGGRGVSYYSHPTASSSSFVGSLFAKKNKKKYDLRVDAHSSTATGSYIGNNNSNSILVKNPGSHLRSTSTNRVEFASSNEIIPLIICDSAVSSTRDLSGQYRTCDGHLCVESVPCMGSPVKTLFGRGHRRAERQSTFESTSSATVEDLLRQETTSTVDSDATSPISSYLLHVHLKEGRDLVIRDASGSSDPYVKFKYKKNLIYKSNTIFKNLNPHWDEQFYELVDDPNVSLHVDVFDYDRFASDDFMGSAWLDLSQLEAKKPTDLKVLLSEENNEQYMGYLLMQINLTPLTREEHENYMRKRARGSQEGTGGSSGSLKRNQKAVQVWNSVVNVVLVEAKNLLPTDIHTSMPLPDPYVKFKLGVEKYKSKPAMKTLEPKWLEQFDLHIFDDQSHQLELMVFDKRKDIFMGRCKIDLSTMEREVTHQHWYELEDGAGQILLLLTISGTFGMDTVGDLHDSPLTDVEAVAEKYALPRSFDNLRDIGHLTVKVYRAQGLASADLGGKSDPFCVVELVNARLQTHTEYKTLNPEWNKIFTFNVKDIHSVLELTVYDEDPNKKVEFLGKVGVPLLKIRNGEKRWYALKDRKLQRRAKGQILLEMELVWNPVRASIRTFNPKEEKYMAQENKFKRQTFMRNVMRVKNFAMAAMDVGAFVQSCFSWDSPPRSIVAFIVYMVVVYFFEIYMLPLALLLLFVKSYTSKMIATGMKHSKDETDEYFESEEEDEDTDEKEEKKTFKERFQAIQDTLAMVQNALDYIASSLERVKNTFNFTQPFLSWLAIVVLCAAMLVLYFIPVRWLAMAWGINKFTKKLRSPNIIPNNELLDFLSRLPSDDEIRMYGEFRPDPVDGSAGAAAIQAARAKKHRSS